MDDHHKEQAQANKKLRTLLSAAGFNHQPGPPGRRELNFSGRFRDWLLLAKLDASWFHVYTYVCALPPEPGLRSELLLWLARANARRLLLKYSVTKADHVVLEFEVRAEKLDAGDVRNLVYFLHATAEEDYLGALRVASGEARLESLSGAFALDVPADKGSVQE